MGKSFEERRHWFDVHASRPTCPCCGYPTLDLYEDYDVCILCQWEHDGQDDPDADEARGGPNLGYSLTHARRNFEDHLSMYDRGETLGGGEDTTETVQAKRSLITAFEELWALSDPKRVASQWQLIGEMERTNFKRRPGQGCY